MDLSFVDVNWRDATNKATGRHRFRRMMYKMHHPKADIDRLYVKKKEGGRGLVQVEAAYKA